MTDVGKKKQTIETYNKSAQFHAKKFNNIGARAKDVKFTFSKVKKENPKTIELGCGNGRDAKEIIKYTNDYLGIDLSSELIKIAKKKVGSQYFKIADIEAYKYPKKIDIVFSFASLLHSDKESVKSVLKKLLTNMNEGGVIFISLKYDKYQERLMNKEGQGPKTFYFYTPDDIKELSPKGFKRIFKEVQNFKGQKWFNIILQKE